MSDVTKHLPLKLLAPARLETADGWSLPISWRDQRRDNPFAEAEVFAPYLMRAVNSHARLIEALEVIAQWADAYPLSVFPEPDFKKAREGLESVGITLDAVSASNMRYVVNGVGEIAKRALTQVREGGE